MDDQCMLNLTGDFTQRAGRTRRRGEKEEGKRIIAEGSRDAEYAEKKKRIPRFARNDSILGWNDSILMMTALGA
jgi:superfamily II RNA helicase